MKTKRICARALVTAAAAVFGVPAVASAQLHPSLVRLSAPASVAVTAVCSTSDVDAHIVEATPIDIPAIVADQTVNGSFGTALLAVELASDGTLLHTAIVHSSGNRWLDRSALAAVRSSRFAPERQNCTDVGGRYEVLADFDH